MAAPVGLALGGAFGVGVTRPLFADRVRPFLARFTSSKPTFANFAIIGLAAALGEETLFRAAIQPSAGILIAALLFTIAHAAIADFRHPSAGKLAYALLALGMGMLLGAEYDHLGIATPSCQVPGGAPATGSEYGPPYGRKPAWSSSLGS